MTQDQGRSRNARERRIIPAVANRPDPLRAVREAYRARLPVLADELLSSCRQAPDDPQALEQLRSLVHRLSGTAGSYGFPLISEAAEDVGQYLERSAPWPEVTERAERLAGRMRETGTGIADEG